ncbi:MAG: FG-GAP-like repeat-containing protein, partial [Gemmataceae bacterium]
GLTQTVIREFFPYEDTFRGGVLVAAGDVNGDGRADIITGTGIGGGPRVQVFDGASGAVLTNFFAYEDSFRGGVQVAAGDINGDGKADVITGTGVGGGPRVSAFDASNTTVYANFFAYEDSFRGGVQVASGDINGGGADIITGTGLGGGPRVSAFDGKNTASRIADFQAFEPNFRGGVRVASQDSNGDGISSIITGNGPGTATRVKAFSASSTTATEIYNATPFDANFVGGVFVG